MSVSRNLALALSLGCSLPALATTQTLALPGLFSDHAVLQRELPLKVWGTAAPGKTVKVSLNGATAEAKAEASGKWMATLPEQKAGGPYELTVDADGETTTIRDILIGDVWVCSGQSNMDFNLKNASTAQEAIASSANPNLRLFKVVRNKALRPLESLEPDSAWAVSGPESTPDFTAVGYFFGRQLQKDLDVPIGLIHTAWGGTKVEWWTPLEGLRKLPFMANEVKEMENPAPDAKQTADYTRATEGWKKGVRAKDPGNGKKNSGWAGAEFDDSSWKSVTLPDALETNEMAKLDGSIWYRRTVEVSDKQASESARLVFCADDDDASYVNGTFVGNREGSGVTRRYNLPAGLLKAGRNTIAIQVWDWGKIGGICSTADNFRLEFGNEGTDKVELSGEWKYSVGVPLKDDAGRPKAPAAIRPTVLYNAMIGPLTNFGIKGATWYQGEGNANGQNAANYDQALAMMVAEWRKAWGIGDFPFFEVQLANFMKKQDQPTETNWSVLRESQENFLKLSPKTAMASAVDVGDENDIHPKDKETVGKRLALNAMAVAYGKDVEYMGPIYKSHEVKDGKIVLTFEHGDKLKTKDGAPLTGFSIAGADKQFVWADAQIVGNTVVVSSPKVPEPVAARYGWASFSLGNLYNGADLPASPFRTDKPEGK